jgi:hypothetical protein
VLNYRLCVLLPGWPLWGISRAARSHKAAEARTGRPIPIAHKSHPKEVFDMVKTRNRLVAAFLTLAMLLNFSATLAAYADGEGENTGEEQSNSIELKWYSTLKEEWDWSGKYATIYYTGDVKVYYPNNTPKSDMAEIEKRLSTILACNTWQGDQSCYPVDSSYNPLLTDSNGDPIETGTAFLAYVNALLAEPVNSHYYQFGTAISLPALKNPDDTSTTPTAPDGYQLYDGNDGADNNDGNDGNDGDDDSNIPFTVTPSSDDDEGSGSVSEPDTALGVVAAPSTESDVVSDLVTAAGLLTVAAQLPSCLHGIFCPSTKWRAR